MSYPNTVTLPSDRGSNVHTLHLALNAQGNLDMHARTTPKAAIATKAAARVNELAAVYALAKRNRWGLLTHKSVTGDSVSLVFQNGTHVQIEL